MKIKTNHNAQFRFAFLLSIILVILFLIIGTRGQAQDLPNPPANIEVIPAGSYVIPMDTFNQAIHKPFNLKAYGLVAEFLLRSIPVKWAIRSGKGHNDIDFTGTAERVYPSYVMPSTVDFAGGPFIIPDTILPCGLTAEGLIKEFGGDVAVFRLTQSVSVDVRYTLTHKPKVAVFTNGGNEDIHSKVLDSAGFHNYDIMDAADIGNLTNCYTFASEPHWGGSESDAPIIQGVKDFVMSGGNFLAQCKAIRTYEYLAKGYFLTTTGLDPVNETVTHTYHNTDMAYLQIHGDLFENYSGSVKNWVLDNGSQYRPTTYPVVYNGTDQDHMIAAAHKLTPANTKGGNVFYLGQHDYVRQKNGVNDWDYLTNVNGLRMYMNCIFVPSEKSYNAWANAGPDVISACSGGPTTIGCNPAGPAGSIFSWEPSTGLSDPNIANPVANPNGTMTYTLTVTDGSGCSAKDEVTISQSGSITMSATATDATCDNPTGGTGTATVNGGVAPITYDWFPGGQSGATVSGLTAGTHTVVITDGSGCIDSVTVNVNVPPTPTSDFSAIDVCLNDSTHFTNHSSISGDSIVGYIWDFGDGNLSENHHTSHIYAQAGTYNVLLVSEAGTGCKDTLMKTVNVYPPPTAAFEAEGACIGTSTQFQDQSTITISSWSWDFGDNNLSTQQHPTHTYQDTGTYTTTLTVISDKGCESTVTKTVRVTELPSAFFTGTNVCLNESNLFRDSSFAENGMISRWFWDFGDGNTSILQHPSHVYSAPGTYEVTLQISAGGCEDSMMISVEVYPMPHADFSFTPENPTVLNPEVTFTDLSIDGVSGTWDFGNGDRANYNPGENHTQTYPDENVVGGQNFDITLSIMNEYGCPDEITKSLHLEPYWRFYIPDAFTPNTDGTNETFFGKGIGILEYEMWIFDRWGNLLFHCDIEDVPQNPLCHWDGIKQSGTSGEIAQQDVYVWKVNLKDIFEERHQYVGHVSLIK